MVSTPQFILGRVAQNVLLLSALGVLFFTVAGTAQVWGYWIYAATVLVYQIASLLIIVPRYPAYIELARVRATKRTDVKKWDRVVVMAAMGGTGVMYGLAALDVGWLHASQLPVGLALAGVLLYVAGSALNQWAMLHNPHFERGVRIEVGSAIAWLGSALCIAAMIARTNWEDTTLSQELAGYAEYAPLSATGSFRTCGEAFAM